MTTRLTPLRMLRLCLKELRESLRDRRTIVTLVLMPLLVYPLLSLILNRVLLTSVTNKTDRVVIFGVGQELKDTQLLGVLNMGYILLRDREASPLFLEPVVEDGKTRSEREQGLSEALPRPQISQLNNDGRGALRTSSVDLVITRKSREETKVAGQQSRRDQAVERVAEFYAQLDTMPTDFDPVQVKELIGHLEVRYREGDARSERALQLMERMLAAVNNESSRELISRNYEAPFRVLATPVIMKSNYADLLATMVPLVLVLMTMAGAVYPAIDLTAGERERGTMEALIVSPVPSYALLLAKYSAVVTVALLTALANLTAMSVTIWVSGIGKLIFGDGVFSLGIIGTVLVLLVLFTMFFAALLLAVTSFAKSFKEAQAYLIPLMLLALTPGIMSLLPGIDFTGLLATVPLVNIVLLAREVLMGAAEWNTAMVAVICNSIYAIAALAVASRLFGADAAVHGSGGGWRDLLSFPRQWKDYPSVDQMALTMAVMFPVYFVASSGLPMVSDDLSLKLWLSALVSYLLILCFPMLVCLYRRIRWSSTFRIEFGHARSWVVWLPSVMLVAVAAWMVAHEIFILGQMLGIGTIGSEHLEAVSSFRESLGRLPLFTVLFVFAFTPAVCEEFLFRGFVLSSLHKYSAIWAIVVSSLLFGLMHVLTSNVLAVERFLPTTFMGLLLGVVAWRTGSIWPGIVLHFAHNALLLCMGRYVEELKSMNFLVEEGQHLPATWMLGGSIAIVVGMGFLFWESRKRFRPRQESVESSQSVLEVPDADPL